MKSKISTPLLMLFSFLLCIAVTLTSSFIYINTYSKLTYYISIVFGYICIHFLIMFIVAPIVSMVFNKKFNYESFWFREKNFESNLYKKLRVKKWKIKLPSYDAQEYSTKVNSTESIIHNMCHAEIIHEFIIVAGYLPILFGLLVPCYILFTLMSVIFSLIHLSFAVIQRYNRPRVIRIHKRSIKKKH